MLSRCTGVQCRPHGTANIRTVKGVPATGSLTSKRVCTAAAASVEETGSVPTDGSLAFGDLSDIIRLVQDTDIVEFELKSKKFTLSVRKREAIAAELAATAAAQAPVQYAAMPMPAPSAPAPAPVQAAAPAPAPAAPAKPAAPAAPKGVEVASPMAGTLYRSAAPGEPPFIKEGDMVKKGQTVCIIEAMKLMNEIEAEIAGEVVKILAENGSPVSPGQPLLLIRPL